MTSLKLLCARNRSKNHLILAKREQFGNGQNWPRCMGYSPCKMLSLGQKLKMPKRCEKRLFDLFKVVLCAKNRSNNHLILEKREQFENGQNPTRCMGYSPCKMLSLGQELKAPKGCEKRLFDLFKVVLCAKNRSNNHLILEKREQFENGQNRQRCMGYSPCKMLS